MKQCSGTERVSEMGLQAGESIILLLPLSLLFQSGGFWLPETCVLFWRPEMRSQAQETLLMRMTTPLMPASIHTIHLILQWLVICLMFVNLFPQPSMKQALTEPPLGGTPICTYAMKLQWYIYLRPSQLLALFIFKTLVQVKCTGIIQISMKASKCLLWSFEGNRKKKYIYIHSLYIVFCHALWCDQSFNAFSKTSPAQTDGLTYQTIVCKKLD